MSSVGPEKFESLGQRLQFFLRLVRQTQASICRKAGKTPAWITEIVKGRSNCPTELLDLLGNEYGLNINWLVTGHGPPRLPGAAPLELPESIKQAPPDALAAAYPKLSERLRDMADDAASLEHDAGLAASVRPLEIVVSSDVKAKMDELGERADQFACVPLMSDAAAAGPPREIDDHAIESFCIIYKKWLGAPSNTVCVRVKGNSMSPIFNDGSIVAINRSRRGPEGLNGKIVAVRHPEDGGVSVRRVVMDALHLSFTPENPAYEPSTGEPANPTIIIERRPRRGMPAPANPIVGKVDWAWSLFP